MVSCPPGLEQDRYATGVSQFDLFAQNSQNAVGTGAQKWWFVVAALFLISLFFLALFIKVWRKTLPPSRAPYLPPDLVFVAEAKELIEEQQENAAREVEPGLGSGDGRWIQPPRND